MISIHLLNEPGNSSLPSVDTGLRHLSRYGLYERIDSWLQEFHVARRTKDAISVLHAEAEYDRYCDELDRRDAIRAAREARRLAKRRSAAVRTPPAWEVMAL